MHAHTRTRQRKYMDQVKDLVEIDVELAKENNDDDDDKTNKKKIFILV